MVEKKEQEAEVKEEQVQQEEPKEAPKEESKEEPKEEKAEKKEPEKKEDKEKRDPIADLGKKEKKIVESIESLSVMELSNLVKALEEKFGVSAAMPVMAGPMAAGTAASAAAEAEEKSTFDVVLTEIGSNKIQVIKEVRAVSNLGLKEAKDLVEAAPKPVVTGVKKEEAEEIKGKLEAVGAKIELK
jgi:large subunit ribosomal protein L7/L12